ncbi:MAG: hypothetical protein ISR87_03440 [Candidatus Marinimicrobia bacterium]|nr:hypothetical protein [FCB group bacterium]MBL7024484.1 hypothetical protein [Candidatus Neomarinimicrobiota bacterium]
MYIVAIMITAVIFSATGLGVLNLATIVNLDTQAAVQTVQDQVEVESFANVALWRVNAGGDNLGTYSSGDLTAAFDSTTQKLSVIKSNGEEQTGLVLSLEEDNHFKRAVATSGTFYTNGRTVNPEPEHQIRSQMGFLPQADLQYFIDHAVEVHYDNSRTFHDGDISEGINVFMGSGLTFDRVELENSTLVFAGTGIDFWKKNVIKADPNADLPALVFTNPNSDFSFYGFWSSYRDEIEGAVYSAGTIRLLNGTLSGPVVAETVVQTWNMDFTDDEHGEYYKWPNGFGSYDDYDWPKQIQEWARIN